MTDKDLEDEGKRVFENTVMNNSLISLKENLQQYQDMLKSYAVLRMTKYKALLDVGFSKEDALKIIIETNLFS